MGISRVATNPSGDDRMVWVETYHRRDGTRVLGHYRLRKRTVLSPSEQTEEFRQNYVMRLEQKEAELKLLEKASELEKRYRKYKKSDPVETWATRWIASPVAYLLPSERREEWLGDLYEGNREMLHKNYPRWMVSIINIGLVIILVTSAMQVKIMDIISSSLGRQK